MSRTLCLEGLVNKTTQTNIVLTVVLWSVVSMPVLGRIAATRARQAHPAVSRLFELVRRDFSGDNAYDTTAFIEQFWRIPGNSGFNESIFRVESILKEAGFVLEGEAGQGERLTYRIERRAMSRPTWEPISASLTLVGDAEPLLDSTLNRNLPCIYSHSTPDGGIDAEIVYVGRGQENDFRDLDVKGKIVFGETSPRWLYRQAIQRRGAIGMLCYSIPDFNQPKEHPQSISFSSMPLDDQGKAWGLMLSHRAYLEMKERMKAGPLRAHVEIKSRIHESEELTIIAQVRGSLVPEEEFVFSAHVQEPGANDNATGVGCLAEIARVSAELLKTGSIDPKRTLTFLWGDEITSTRRYVTEDANRARGIKWGISLDMVGEDTSRTGGTFLIEKMPDPSAVWPRGDDHFSEWGGQPIGLDRMKPHYFNDFIINRCLDQAAETGWVVGTNPFEGGSDHVPFLRAGIPGLLMWHFTDVYYHTDGDRIEMVSRDTLRNVGVSALVSALILTSADHDIAEAIRDEIVVAGRARFETELELSTAAVHAGQTLDSQAMILRAWIDWYVEAIRTCLLLPSGSLDEDWINRTHTVALEIELEWLDRLNGFLRLADGH